MCWSFLAVLLTATVVCEVTSFGGKSPPQLGSHPTHKVGEVCTDAWFIPSGPNGNCECGHTFGDAVICNEETREVGVLDCFCMTFDSTYNRIVFGQCLYNCINVSKSYHDSIYHTVPRSLGTSDDNNSVCGYLHSKGRLCGECMDMYYRAAYSYTFECVHCENSQWLEYIAIAYGPLTLFILFILVFRVSVVSPKLYGVISMLQTLAAPLNIRVIQQAAKHDKQVYPTARVILVMLSIWNLDFFRDSADICLRLSPLQVMALDYLIAVYPMVVTVTAFVVLELHNRGFAPVLFMCRPFHRAFANFRQSWNLRTSLIDAFVTFFILSTTKLLHVSVSILLNITIYDAKGNNLGHYLIEDASIEFFRHQHRPYAILAVSVVLFLIILPIVLLVCYQFAFCQVCLTKCRLKSHVMENYMHTFNQYYKNGSGGTRDCRWFAAFHVMARLGVYLLLFLSLSAIFYNWVLMYVLVCTLAVVLIEPYKEEYKYHNYIEPCVYLSLALIEAGITGINISNLEMRSAVKPLFMFTALVAMIPMAYLTIMTGWWLFKRNPCGYRLVRKPQPPDIPDRLLNSGNYHSSHESSFGDSYRENTVVSISSTQ